MENMQEFPNHNPADDLEHLDKEVILEIAEKIIGSNVPNKEAYFEDKYVHFKTKYPVLYKACCSPNFDVKMLKYMLSMLDNVKSNKTTQEDASVTVGQKLFDKFVDPVVKKL